jgi:multidrug resistance efflux pump
LKTFNEFQQRLREFRRLDDESAPRELAMLSGEITGAAAAGYFQWEGGAGEQPLGGDIIVRGDDTQPLRDALRRSANVTRRSRQLSIQRNASLAIVSMPLDSGQRDSPVLSVALRPPHVDPEPIVHSLRMLAAHELVRSQERSLEALEWQTGMSAGMVEIVSALQRAEGVEPACVLLANRLRDLLRCEHVAVGVVSSKPRRRVRLRAISGRTSFDPGGETERAFQAAMEEALVRGQLTCWPPGLDTSHPGPPAHRTVADDLRTGHVVSALIESPNKRLVAVVVLCSIRDDVDELMRFTQASSRYLGSTLDFILQEGSAWSWPFLKRFKRRVMSPVRAVILTGVFALLLLTMPVSHNIDCDCTVRPTYRRVVVVPHDGMLEAAYVQPGDIVRRGDLLARMDGAEIRRALARAEADRQRATQQREKHLARYTAADRQMAALEIERLELNIKLLEYRRRDLDIQASVDGIVQRGDVPGARGTRVKTGQSLFEIAPLESLRLDAQLESANVDYVSAGMDVAVRLEALPAQQLRATVTRVDTQAEVANGRSTVRTELLLQDSNEVLRPGMRGTARIIGQRRPLGWILFHGPLQRLFAHLGW